MNCPVSQDQAPVSTAVPLANKAASVETRNLGPGPVLRLMIGTVATLTTPAAFLALISRKERDPALVNEVSLVGVGAELGSGLE
jgi:hypothetical protein